jgi:hypothetical protein
MGIIEDLMTPTMQLEVFCTSSENPFLFTTPILILQDGMQKEKGAFLWIQVQFISQDQ